MKHVLNKVIDETVKGESSDSVDKLLKGYLTFKAKNTLREFIGDSVIKFDGDEVLVNGKVVGTVDIDLMGEKPITFRSTDGKVVQEFDEDEVDATEKLYSFLEKTYIR